MADQGSRNAYPDYSGLQHVYHSGVQHADHSGVQHADHSGLQHVEYSGLEPVQHHAGLEPIPPSFQQQSVKEAHAAAYPGYPETYNQQSWIQPPSDAPHEAVSQGGQRREKILGLSVRAFWIVVVLLVLVVAGAIGGGVGGGLAARNRAESSSPTAGNEAAGPVGSETTTTVPPQATTDAKTETTATPTTSTTTPSPTNQGCPSINGTTVTALDANGNEIKLPSASGGMSFLKLCNTNYPADGTNPRIRDLMKIYRPKIDDCISACAEYNAGNFREGNSVSKQELCRNVAIDSTQNNYCFLKNDTGRNLTVAASWHYTSANLIDFGL